MAGNENMQYKIRRREVTGMEALIKLYIHEMKLAPALNTQRVFQAWDQASGASRYTISRFFRDGVLTVGMSSSMVRSHLDLQKDAIIRQINDILLTDELFTWSGDSLPVKQIILK